MNPEGLVTKSEQLQVIRGQPKLPCTAWVWNIDAPITLSDASFLVFGFRNKPHLEISSYEIKHNFAPFDIISALV